MSIKRFVPLATLTALVAVTASAQQAAELPVAKSTYSSWSVMQTLVVRGEQLDVITMTRPEHRHGCRVQAITPDKLVCAGPCGKTRTYGTQEVLTLIQPGDSNLRVRLLLGLNAALGAGVWGTVVLVASCPVCAAATALVSLALFGAAGAILYTDPQSDRLVYLAPGRRLTGRLRVLQP